MGLPDHKAEVHSSGQQCDIWRTEFTLDGSSVPTLDTATDEGEAWTDSDPRLADSTRLAKSATGKIAMKFPKSRRAWPRDASFEPATPGTTVRMVQVTDIDAVNGTCVVWILDGTFAAADCDADSRVRVALELEYR